jgi:hypothetical protein
MRMVNAAQQAQTSAKPRKKTMIPRNRTDRLLATLSAEPGLLYRPH